MMNKALSRRARELDDRDETIAVEPVPEAMLEGLRRALLGGETHYTDRPGMKALRARIGERLGLEPDAVVITAGEKEARYVVELSGLEAAVVARALDITSAEPLPELAPSTIVVGTLEGAPELHGFRLAFLAASPELAAKLKSWKQALSICTAAPSQRAALLAWESR